MEEEVRSKRDPPKVNKFKEEYSTVANDLNFVFLWMQRELLASQTLSDLALKNRRRKEDISHLSDTSPSTRSRQKEKEEEDDPMCSSSDCGPSCSEDGKGDSWSQYIPPSQTTCSTLETTNNTERTVMANPNAAKLMGDEMLDIAHALEDLHCESKKRVPNAPVEPQAAPKPKKRRRRRHEIARNFKCTLNNCTKSYGSEGALKTHVRLKHAEGSDKKKDRDRPASTIWSSASLAGAPMPHVPNIFKPLAGETHAPPQLQASYGQQAQYASQPIPYTSNHQAHSQPAHYTASQQAQYPSQQAQYASQPMSYNPGHQPVHYQPQQYCPPTQPHNPETLRLPPPNLMQSVHPPSELPSFNFLFHTASGLTTH